MWLSRRASERESVDRGDGIVAGVWTTPDGQAAWLAWLSWLACLACLPAPASTLVRTALSRRPTLAAGLSPEPVTWHWPHQCCMYFTWVPFVGVPRSTGYCSSLQLPSALWSVVGCSLLGKVPTVSVWCSALLQLSSFTSPSLLQSDTGFVSGFLRGWGPRVLRRPTRVVWTVWSPPCHPCGGSCRARPN